MEMASILDSNSFSMKARNLLALVEFLAMTIENPERARLRWARICRERVLGWPTVLLLAGRRAAKNELTHKGWKATCL